MIKRVQTFAKRDKMPTKLQFLICTHGKFTPDTDDDALLVGVDDNNQITGVEDNEQDSDNDDKPPPLEYADYKSDSDDEEDDDDESIDSNELIELQEDLQTPVRANQTITRDEAIEELEPEQPTRPQQQHNLPQIMNIADTNTQSYNRAQLHQARKHIKQLRNKIKRLNSNHTNKHKIHHEQPTNLFTQTIQPDFEYEEDNVIPLATIVTSLVQTFSLKAGIKKFGTKGQQAVFDEMNQLHLCSCFNPIDVTTLTPQEQARVLNSLIFLTKKLDGRVKARTVADGSKQCLWKTKEETASPTVSLPSILLTCTIEAHENREVAVVDIPNAFPQTDNIGEWVIMKIKGELVLILVQTCPELYKPFLTDEKGIPTLYVQIDKALYGMLQSSLLFYKKLVKDLTKNGFIINPYDPCVANKVINGKQLTITWHVNNLKVSSKSKGMLMSSLNGSKSSMKISPQSSQAEKKHMTILL